jgi:mevalonate kinase
MTAVTATAPGKAILFGEHAVVYGQPALAVPVTLVRATASVTMAEDGFWIDAPDLGPRYRIDQAEPADPLAAAVALVCGRAGLDRLPSAALRVTSTIPIASGLGSGAAACTAVVRALAAFLGLSLSDGEVSALVFETEMLLHGTPSGIDNTVIAYGRPVYFVKGQVPVACHVANPFRLVIADTGRPSATKITVSDVRAAFAREPERYGRLFEAVGAIVQQARQVIESGAPDKLGPLMTRNHSLLQEMAVSSPELDDYVARANAAGAGGSKLSGGGRGGTMLALVTAETEAPVRQALLAAGAVRVMGTIVE